MPKFSPDATPKYRKHKASGQAIVTLSGQDHYLVPHGTKASRREYDRLIVEWIAGGRLPLVQMHERRLPQVDFRRTGFLGDALT